jgi:hypothetical protein
VHGLLIRGLWVRVPPRSSKRARYDGDARIARSPQTRPTSVPHPTHERIGERVAVGVEHVPVNVSENAAEPCPITVCTALAMRRHVVYHDDPQVLELCLHPCDRLHWLRRVPMRSSVGIARNIVGAAQGALPDRVAMSTTGGAAQDGAYPRTIRDLAFPGSLIPRRQS